MKNPRLKQIANLMYLHSRIVSAGSRRQRAVEDLTALKSRMGETSKLLYGNDIVRSSLAFLSKLIDSWF